MNDSAYQILCVDDEPRVLQALERHLRDRFSVLTAGSGADGITLLERNPDVAVVVSDMRMPEMDGATFLRHSRALRPGATRVLLTGQADIAAAIKAINEGQIFRFLTKPCAPEQFLSVMAEAVRQHELVIAERLLLQRTLIGALKALTDIMALVSPAVIGRAQRLKRRVSSLATHLQLDERWQVEAAALLSYLGHVSLPDSLTYKLSRGLELDSDEETRLRDAMRASNRLVAHVPRLEPVSAILMALTDPDSAELRLMAAPDPVHVQVLQLAMEVERLENQGLRGAAIAETLEASGDYSAELLAALRASQSRQEDRFQRAEVSVAALAIGMYLDEDITTVRGVLIAPRGCEVTPSFIEHIRHFAEQLSRPTIAISHRTMSSPETPEL